MAGWEARVRVRVWGGMERDCSREEREIVWDWGEERLEKADLRMGREIVAAASDSSSF